jgi:hypothetical protein
LPGWPWNSGRLLGAALLLAVAVQPVAAQVDQGRALAAIEAGQDIEAALAGAGETGAAPRLSGGEYQKKFAEVLDLSIAGEGVQSAAGMALLMNLQRSAGDLVRAYLFFGIKGKSLKSEEDSQQAARNFVAFLPEMAALYDYRLRVGAVIAQGAAAMPGPTPDPMVSTAVAAVASEQEKVLNSALAVASDLQLDARWRAARVQALLETTPGYTALLGRKKAQQIADKALVAARAETDAEVALLLKNYALALLR